MSHSRLHPARDLMLAASTLTAVPVRVTWPDGDRTDAPGYYPLVGLVLGGIAFGLVQLLRALGWTDRAPLVVGVGVVAFFALATRMLHWDGLADVFDAMWTSDHERALEIMRDSATGAFGVTAIALGVVAQTAALAQVVTGGRSWVLLVVPVFGRLAAAFGAWFGRPARTGGLGASVIGRPRMGAVVPLALVVALCVALGVVAGGAAGVWLSVGGMVLALAVPHLIALRFGGVTGDVMGASVVVVETVLLAILAVTL